MLWITVKRLYVSKLLMKLYSPRKQKGKAMTQHPSLPRVGYLRSCMDRRYVAETRRIFEKLAQLGGAEYFQEAYAGGTLNNLIPDFPTNSPPTPNGADYVYGRAYGSTPDLNLVAMGWQVHLDHCGGLPELTNDQIVDKFRRLILAGTLQTKYPKVPQHLFLVQPAPPQPVPVPADTTLTFDSTGAPYNTWCHVFYRDLNGQLLMWDSGTFTPSQVTTTVPGGSTNVFIEGGVIGGPPIFNTGSSPIVTNAYAGGGSLASGAVTVTLSGTATAPIFTVNPPLV